MSASTHATELGTMHNIAGNAGLAWHRPELLSLKLPDVARAGCFSMHSQVKLMVARSA